MNRYLLPLAVFVILLVFLGFGLTLNPREVPSPLIGKPAPTFRLPQLHQAERTISRQDMLGKVWALNVWASWCVSCREEHQVLLQLSKSNALPIIGLNHKDKRGDALRWLTQFGDPYQLSAFDNDGRVGIDYGVYGVPETFIVDKKGIIRYKCIGPVTPQIVQEKILPLVADLNKEA